MRNFNERKAEILRRSAERIQARKAMRKRILALCLPLTVCLALFAGWALSPASPILAPGNDSIGMNAVTDANCSDVDGSNVGGSSAVENGSAALLITENGIERAITDPDTIAAVSQIIEAAAQAEAESDQQKSDVSTDDTADIPTGSTTGSSVAPGTGTTALTITLPGGTTYRLEGTILTGDTQTLLLTEEQKNQLLTVLSLS